MITESKEGNTATKRGNYMYVSLSTCGFQHPPGIENEFRYRYLSILLIRSFGLRVKVLVFNITFINISVISRRSVLLIEDTGVPEVC
jgi:hypothetical protein